jgi:hypothetical protein
MDKPVRVELHLRSQYGPSEEPPTPVISCEISEVEIGHGRRRWFAHGTPSKDIPEFTAWSSHRHAAMLAVFAKWLGVVQPLREALAHVEREAWAKDGRSRFRRALGVLLDKLDSRHTHDVSEFSQNSEVHNAAIDALWRIGCAAFRVAFDGCAINPVGSPYFLIDEWVQQAELALRGSLELRSAAAQSAARQLLDLAEWTRRR